MARNPRAPKKLRRRSDSAFNSRPWAKHASAVFAYGAMSAECHLGHCAHVERGLLITSCAHVKDTKCGADVPPDLARAPAKTLIHTTEIQNPLAPAHPTLKDPQQARGSRKRKRGKAHPEPAQKFQDPQTQSSGPPTDWAPELREALCPTLPGCPS